MESFMEWVIELTDRTLRDTGGLMLNTNPIVHEQSSFNGQTPIVGSDQKRHNVLLVDDEPALLKLFSDVLRNQGYTVRTANSGEAAIDLCKNRKDPIDILISDVVMQKKEGFEVEAAVRAAHPEVVVMLMSGTPIDFARLGPSTGFLAKPITPAELLAAISLRCDVPANAYLCLTRYNPNE